MKNDDVLRFNAPYVFQRRVVVVLVISAVGLAIGVGLWLVLLSELSATLVGAAWIGCAAALAMPQGRLGSVVTGRLLVRLDEAVSFRESAGTLFIARGAENVSFQLDQVVRVSHFEDLLLGKSN